MQTIIANENEIRDLAINSLPAWMRQMLADRMERYMKANDEDLVPAATTATIDVAEKNPAAESSNIE
jgi:hypothetical protein